MLGKKSLDLENEADYICPDAKKKEKQKSMKQPFTTPNSHYQPHVISLFVEHTKIKHNRLNALFSNIQNMGKNNRKQINVYLKSRTFLNGK